MSIKFTTSAHSYEIQEILGESLFSVVYLASRTDTDLKIKMPIVIKIFKKKEHLLPILHIESLLRARHSAHLVKALSFEKFHSCAALILEYIPGVNLKQLIKSATLNKNEIACICSQTLTGLKELRKNGFSHGDISLSNILIDINGSVYLTDYGLGNSTKNFTYSTKPFTAPELLKGKVADFQSDLFSLGVLEKILFGKGLDEELSRLENSHFIHKEDPLLDPSPEKRFEKKFSFSQEALSSLGKKTQHILFIKKCFSRKKKPVHPILPLPPTKKQISYKSVISYTLLFLGLLFAVNPFISYGKHKPSLHPAEVLIRTKKWVYVKMSGFTGYPPLTIRVKKPGSYKLKWKSHKKSGVKYIHLTSGQRIVLRDKDFFKQPK